MNHPILDPTGRGTTAPGVVLSPRPPELDGLTVGLLDNGKRNAARYLEELGVLLHDVYGTRTITARKASFALPVTEAEVAELAATCDVVVTGIGDCGSCSASAVVDGVLLERAGVPTAVLCSDAFTAAIEAMLRLRDAEGYRYLTTEHPVADLSPDEVRDRARRSLPDVVATLTATTASAA